MRDNFSRTTIAIIAKRAGYRCSNPRCRRATVGPQPNGEGSINVGVAAHITAASAGGPRYDAMIEISVRQSRLNGIWLCQRCAKLIDSDEQHFTVDLLREWQRIAEEQAYLAIATEQLAAAAAISIELDSAELELLRRLHLPPLEAIDALAQRLRAAGKEDIQAFKRMRGWPPHPVLLNLRMRDHDGAHTVSLAGVAAAIDLIDEIALVAAPGTGKTTTLIQLADAILSSDRAVPVIVPLAEWSSRSDGFLRLLTRRNAFQGFGEQHFMLLALCGQLVLLLDGWNELDGASRARAIHELTALRRDFPLLRVAVSTRRQGRDVPVSGPIIEIEALSEQQQLEIARAVRGKAGEALLDQAWRTAGIRELVSVPLYLQALIAFATSGTMPNTKEAVLRLFVMEHEKTAAKADILQRELLGFHQHLLIALAVDATNAATTSIQDARARGVIRDVEARLEHEGQITTQPQPAAILDALVDRHTLIRPEANGGVSFQHQQFQEWYASFEVERLMRVAKSGDVAVGKKLAAEVIDMPAWEEPILFACERLSRTDVSGSNAVADAVLLVLGVDPMLAADMIYRSSPAVWDAANNQVIAFVERWHELGKVDRAVGFMISTGRPEFAVQIWPLITDPDMQVHLSSLRRARRFRPEVLGPDVRERIAGSSEEVRQHVISEIASNGGIEGIELATSLVIADPSAAVQFAAIESLLFRRADRFATEILKTASDEVWRLLVRKGHTDEIVDPDVVTRLRLERRSYLESEAGPLQKLHMILEEDGDSTEAGDQIQALIESETFPARADNVGWVLERAYERYPQPIASALVRRIEIGRELPFRCSDFLSDVATIDEGAIPEIVIASPRGDRNADLAASVVGPRTIGILIDKLIAHSEETRGSDKPFDEDTTNEHFRLMTRISLSNVDAFLQALRSRCSTEDPRRIGILADVIARHGNDVGTAPLRATPVSLEPTVDHVRHWIEVLLTSPVADRHQFAEVARAIERLPDPAFVDSLRRLLAEDQVRWKEARKEFFARPVRGSLPADVTHSYKLQYQRAFIAIGDAQVTDLMGKYLAGEEFGFEAACVLKAVSEKGDDTSSDRFRLWPDFSGVTERQQRRRQGMAPTSPHAEAIFAAIDRLVSSESTEEEQRHALRLAPIALAMPYGEKPSAITALLALPRPALEKRGLLMSLVLAGETIDAEMVLAGFTQMLAEAQQKPWLVDGPSNEIEKWLELLPFSNRPAAFHEALALLGARFREPWHLQRLLSALGSAPDLYAEQILAELAESDRRFYRQHEWLAALLGRGTESSATLLLDLICRGQLVGNETGHGAWGLGRHLASVVRHHISARNELIRRYPDQIAPPNIAVIEYAIAELGDEESVLPLLRGYAKQNRRFDGTLQNLIENVALSKKELDRQGGSYELHGRNIAPLRKQLLAMLNDGSAETSLAEACLTAIDELRDEYGRIESEPRHPDITSGRAWPLAAAGVNAAVRAFA